MTFFRPADVSRIEPVAQGEENLDAQINTQQADFYLLGAPQREANYIWVAVFRAWPVEDLSRPARRDKNQQQADQADQVIVVQVAGLFEQEYIGETEKEKSDTEAIEETC